MWGQDPARQANQAEGVEWAWKAATRTVTNYRKRKKAAVDLLNWISVHYCIIVFRESATYAPKKEEGQEEEEG